MKCSYNRRTTLRSAKPYWVSNTAEVIIVPHLKAHLCEINLQPPRTTCIMSGVFEVNCLVLGDPEAEIFTVDIVGTKNISALKDIIKIKRDDLFRDVVASKITVGTAFKKYAEIEGTTFPPTKLMPLLRINEVFINLDPTEVHVIIAPPAGKYNSFRFNHAYLLTVLSSLKLLRLVSKTRISFFNYPYLLTVLSVVVIARPPAGNWTSEATEQLGIQRKRKRSPSEQDTGRLPIF